MENGMPGVVISSNGASGGLQPQLEGKMTIYVIVCGIIAATGGIMFGYDTAISGGVTSMDDFLLKFFPSVYVKKHQVKEDNYCKFNDNRLQLFTSSLYLAALVASFFASRVCTIYGRKLAIQAASVFFLVGVVFNAAAQNLGMLICGRLLLGIGVGFASQAVPLFLSEIAPVRLRGGLNILFQLNVTVGIFMANVVNFVVADIHPWGWRLSLGLAGIPASILFFGSIIITETPNSLIERQHLNEGLVVLRKIRGTDNVQAEYDELVGASEVARRVTHPFRNLMKRSSRPPLVIAIVMQVFQQFTGINAIMFYAPVMFQAVGFGGEASLMSSVIIGVVNVVCTDVSIVLVDRLGRRWLLLEACVQMFLSQLAIGIILFKHMQATNTLDYSTAICVVGLVCVFISSFAWSWGPMGWLIPSETFPLENRTCGFAFAVSSNMLMTFIIAQSFLSMLCVMRSGIFFFFAGWIVVMGLFVLFLLPETKNVPIDEMVERVWKRHWFWKGFMNDDQ